MSSESVTINNPAIHNSHRIALLLGAGAAGIAAAGVVAPWMLGLVGATLVFGLSFVENEPFLLSLVFLLPLDIQFSQTAFIRDVAVSLRAVVFVGFFLGRWYRGQIHIQKIWRSSVSRASVLFLACLMLSMLGSSGEIHAELHGIYYFGTYMAYCVVALEWLDTAERRRKVMLVLFSSTIVVGAFAVIQVLSGGYTWLWHLLYSSQEWMLAGIDQTGRVPSFLGHPNHLASYVNLILPFGIACYLLSNERLWKWLSALTVVLGVVALALSQSRGGYLAFAAIIVYATWHFAKTRWQRALLTVAFASLAVGVYVLLKQWNPGHFDEYTNDNSLWGRLLLWDTAWNLFLSSPLHGVGISTFSFLYQQFLPNIPDLGLDLNLEVHNIYFELLAETGILGFLSFFGVVVMAYREARHQWPSADWFQHALAFGVAAGIVGALVGEFFDHSIFWAPQVAFLFWLGVGGVVASARNSCDSRERGGLN
jgi:O-antigen ligase